jgi:general stress protein 26
VKNVHTYEQLENQNRMTCYHDNFQVCNVIRKCTQVMYEHGVHLAKCVQTTNFNNIQAMTGTGQEVWTETRKQTANLS